MGKKPGCCARVGLSGIQGVLEGNKERAEGDHADARDRVAL